MLAFVEEESEYWQDVLVSIGTTRLQGLHPNTNHFVLKQSQLLLKPLELRKLPPEIVTKAKFITTKSRLLYLLRMKWNFAKKTLCRMTGHAGNGQQGFLLHLIPDFYFSSRHTRPEGWEGRNTVLLKVIQCADV